MTSGVLAHKQVRHWPASEDGDVFATVSFRPEWHASVTDELLIHWRAKFIISAFVIAMHCMSEHCIEQIRLSSKHQQNQRVNKG